MSAFTSRTTRRSATAALGLLAALGLAVAAAPAASAARGSDPGGRYTAAEIHTFIEDFYGEHGPSAFARAYGISRPLAKKAAEAQGFDLLLCAQNQPRSIDVGPATTAQSAGVGWATVTTYWADGSIGSFEAYVDLDATRTLQLQDVSCTARR